MPRVCLAFLIVCVLTFAASAAETEPDERRSGTFFMSRDLREMQTDPASNPGMLWVKEGERLWYSDQSGRSCFDCHGEAKVSMTGVATRYPAFNSQTGQPMTLEQRINRCLTDHQNTTPLAYESKELLALTAFVATQSRGLAIEAGIDKRLDPFVAAGRALFNLRQGQLNLSCAQCHQENWDKRLGGNAITQAHPTGYPLYRLEWQGLGSLGRRLRNCLFGIRARLYDYGAPELVALEVYLMWRARGMGLETPAIRP